MKLDRDGWEFKMLDGGSEIGRIGTDLSINLMEDFRMSLFRFAAIAVALMIPFGLAQATTSNTPPPPSFPTLTNPHPSFSVTEDRALDLRETGSQIVMQTIESALRQGGLALLGEGFQLDSSLSYHSGDNEGIEGDLDVVIPLWNGGRHAIFTQPGFVFWKGLEGEKRIDGNFGLVYRGELTRNLIAGASVFYDHDFQIGHSRVGGGLDLQGGYFRLGANYYHPLSEEEDGREGFIEEALRGMDARIVFEKEAVHLGGTIGYWEYDGGENVEDEWRTSFGLDFGIRIFPGVFAEASWERHKGDVVLDERIFTGLAFRFSLPDFEGASYGSGERTSNLYKIVGREKRILYEERESDGILLSHIGSVMEGNPIDISVQLKEASTEDVTLSFIGSGSAEYGPSNDWVMSVDGGTTNCAAVTGTSCSITIVEGETRPTSNVVITINDDGRGENAETIVLSTTVTSGDTSLTSRPLVLTIPEDSPLPTVSFNYNGSRTVQENAAVNHVTMTLELSETLTEAVTLNLVAGGTATYGRNTINDDWQIRRRIVSIGDSPSDDEILFTGCNSAVSGGNGCEVTFQPGETVADIHLQIHEDGKTESPEDFAISVEVASGSTHLVQTGNPSRLEFTIEDQPPPTVSLNYSGPTHFDNPHMNPRPTVRMTIELSRVLVENVTLNIVGTDSETGAKYGSSSIISNDWFLRHQVVATGSTPGGDVPDTVDICPGVTGTMCQVTIPAGSIAVDVEIQIFSVDLTDETINVEINVASAGSTGLVLGSSSRQTLTYGRP